MSATHSSKFYWTDWLGDQAVRRLSLAERGLWIDLLALAAGSNPVGYVCDDKGKPLTHEEIARVTNAGSPVEVAELIASILRKGAASRDRTGRLFNRRMVRDAEMFAKRARAGRDGAERTNLINKTNKDLVQQMSHHMTHQNKTATPGPYPNPVSKSSFSSETVTPRATNGLAEEKPQPTGSLATALPTGALARQLIAETSHIPAPSAARRAELDDILRKKRATTPVHQDADT